MSVNKAFLIGNVGEDPKVTHLDSGDSVAEIRLATSESYKNKEGEKITNVEWHNVVLWRGLAEIVEKYVKKGQQLHIEGKITTKSWENDKGEKRYKPEIVASSFQMLGKKEE